MDRAMNIGETADAAGVTTKMMRHYEQTGVVPAAARADSGCRRYTERDGSALRFIGQSRRLGFSIEQIAELLDLWSDSHRVSRSLKAVAQQHVADLEQKTREMAAMKRALERLVASCHGDDRPHCAILAELAGQSPTAPDPGSIGPGALRMSASARRPAGARAGAPATPEPTASHAGLMAWTHQLRHQHGGH